MSKKTFVLIEQQQHKLNTTAGVFLSLGEALDYGKKHLENYYVEEICIKSTGDYYIEDTGADVYILLDEGSWPWSVYKSKESAWAAASKELSVRGEGSLSDWRVVTSSLDRV